jgi:hypothetical protein
VVEAWAHLYLAREFAKMWKKIVPAKRDEKVTSEKGNKERVRERASERNEDVNAACTLFTHK